MSQLKFEILNEANFHDAIRVCNWALGYDAIRPSALRRVTFQDPNYEPTLAFLAYEDGKPVGFTVGCRRVRAPVEWVNPTAGWVKLVAGVTGESHGQSALLGLLCERVEAELTRLGAKTVRFADFASWHLWAGVDVRYEEILDVLEQRGYSKVGETVDYLVDLGAFTVPDRVRRLREQVEAKGVAVAPGTDAERTALCSWIGAKFGAGWAYEAGASFDNAELNRSGTLVAKDMRTDEFVGFSTFGALDPDWFGPIGVEESRRKLGIGTVLLFEALLFMRLGGVVRAVIPWTSHLFFYSQVPGIVGIRHYWIMGKRLA